jgi:hypothetical protein
MARRLILFLVLTVSLFGCGDEAVAPDYLRIAGGGLNFNYRYSELRMVLVAKQVSPLPEGSTLVVLFDIPGSTARERVERPALTNKLTYKLESSPLFGVKKDQTLTATLLLIAPDGKELDRDEKRYVSDRDQEGLPTKPLIDPSKPNYLPQLENLDP